MPVVVAAYAAVVACAGVFGLLLGRRRRAQQAQQSAALLLPPPEPASISMPADEGGAKIIPLFGPRKERESTPAEPPAEERN